MHLKAIQASRYTLKFAVSAVAIFFVTSAHAAIPKSTPADAAEAVIGEAVNGRIVAGWVEKLELKPWGDMLKAKLDTGAKTSSINADNITRFNHKDKEWVRFVLTYKTVQGEEVQRELERPVRRNIRVKEHAGKNVRRPVVELSFCFAGELHKTQFSLIDRSKFVYPVLLGRRFLQENSLINPAETFLTQPNCPISDNPTAEKAEAQP